MVFQPTWTLTVSPNILLHLIYQMVVEEESMPLLALATHKGLYAFTRLAFGASVAPALWQNKMKHVLINLDAVQAYYDDIFGGRTKE